MRDRLGTLIVLAVCSSMLSCAGSDVSSGANAGCIERLIVPSYPPLNEKARVTGDVGVLVVVGDDGSAARISLETNSTSAAAKQAFDVQVRKTLASSSFSEECRGKSVTVGFSFVLGNPASQDQTISFKYPNRFQIAARAFPMQY